MQFKQTLISQFSFLFGQTIGKQGDGELEDFSLEGQFGKRWGWFNAFHTLSQGDATKFEQTAKINVYTALTYLSYIKDKNDIERKLMKRK